MQILAIPFVIFQLTGSPLWVGLTAVVQYGALFAAGPLGGWVADNRTRRTTLLTTQTAQALVAAALWLSWVLGSRSPYVLLLAVAASGFVLGINAPSWDTFVNDLVPREDIRSAVTMNSVMWNTARAIGPALAGLTLAILGATWTFGLNAVSFGAVLGALALVRTRGVPNTDRERHGVLRSFGKTLVYVVREPSVVVVLLTSVVIGGLGFPVMTFSIVMAGDVYHVGPAALGVMTAFIGFGAILAAPLVSGWPRVIPLSRVVFIALVTFGSALLMLAALPYYAAGIVAMALVGVAFLAGNSGINASLQLSVAAAHRGRAMALRVMTFTLATSVGAFLQGLAAEHLGPRPTMAIFSMLLFTATAVLAFNRSQFRLGSLNPRPYQSITDPAEHALPN